MPVVERFSREGEVWEWVFAGCRVVHYPLTQYTETIFDDGTKVPAAPEDTPEYRQTANRLGYGDDTNRMCRDHEILHSYLAAKAGEPHSRVMWDLAHNLPVNKILHELEEQRVLDFTALMNGVQMVCRQDWREWAEEAKMYLR